MGPPPTWAQSVTFIPTPVSSSIALDIPTGASFRTAGVESRISVPGILQSAEHRQILSLLNYNQIKTER